MRSDIKHFAVNIADAVAIVRLNRPERKNPLTFESYAELRDWFRDLRYDDKVKAVVFAGTGGNFSSGRARNHRAAERNVHEGASRLHPYDG